ncbi:Integrase OS=Streptomyces microflavus OX=1919 GN=Smic_07850 PE=4 SV=1 [Streptomyces microflavus]
MDAQLNEAADDLKVLEDDRHLENLLSKLSKVLHVGAAASAGSDPSKALCLKLVVSERREAAGGDVRLGPLPQATHHRSHRPVWLGQVTVIDTFVESPRVAKGEKNRLLPERDRALRVVAEIDAASPAA